MYNFFMYIFELVVNLIKNRKNKAVKNNTFDNSVYEKCEHIFLPIDSTSETLACTKCGQIVKSDSLEYKPKNPFN